MHRVRVRHKNTLYLTGDGGPAEEGRSIRQAFQAIKDPIPYRVKTDN
jgi:hypothetical protein